MNDAVILFISGDFCPAKADAHQMLQESVAASVFGEFHENIQRADLAITNLECPLTTWRNPITKIGPALKASPGIAVMLRKAGFGLVTLANNHIYDYGREGLEDTLVALQNSGIAYVGAGRDLAEAQTIYCSEIKGIKIALVNFCEIEFSCANSEHGGANPMNLIDNVHQIQEARKNADHVIVIVHGGHEHYRYPSPETLKRYRFYAEQGVSAVIAHHTHCIGGYENWQGVPIFYSLGNFFFPNDHQMPDWWNEGYALDLTLKKDSLSFEILPYEQCRGSELSLDRRRNQEIFLKIEGINVVLKDNDLLMRYWEQFICEKEWILTNISGFGRYKTAIFRRLKLSKYFYKTSQLCFVRQMLRCEAHREVSERVLSNYLKEHEIL